MIVKTSDISPPPPKPLPSPKPDQLVHILRGTAQNTPEEEHDDGQLEDALATVEISCLAPQRCRGSAGQQIDGDDPRQQIASMKVADDRRQRRRHNRLIEGGEEHPQHQPGHDHQNLAMRESNSPPLLRIRGRRRAHAWHPRIADSSV